MEFVGLQKKSYICRRIKGSAAPDSIETLS